MAVQGSAVEALTGDETFRIPIARASLAREGEKILIRDAGGSLAIWCDDDGILEVLERAQRGTLKDQVARLRAGQRRRRALRTAAKSLVVAAALFAASIPLLRWAVRGGVPVLADKVGETALEHLDLPAGVAPTVEGRLAVIESQLRPVSTLSTRSLRVLLADYADIHSFCLPPNVVVVTAGLVCGAEEAEIVTEAVARELAHLENRDVHQQVAEAVDWHAPLNLAVWDLTRLRDHMLDFADPKRSPGFTPEQEIAADERALDLMKRAGVPLTAGQDLKALADKLKQLREGNAVATPQKPAPAGEDALDWAKVRAEACAVIGR